MSARRPVRVTRRSVPDELAVIMAREYADQDLSVRQLGERHGYGYGPTRAALRRLDVQLRKPGRRPGHPAPRVGLYVAIPDEFAAAGETVQVTLLKTRRAAVDCANRLTVGGIPSRPYRLAPEFVAEPEVAK